MTAASTIAIKNPTVADVTALASHSNVLRSFYKTYQKQGLSTGKAMTLTIATDPIVNVALAEPNARRGNNAVKNFERHKQS